MSIKKLFCLLACTLILLSALPVSSGAAFTGNERVVIVLDPGHGGGNIGTAANGVGEKVFTMRMATLIKQHLEANGSFIVHMTRTGDYDLEICERGMYANDVNADALISLHFDGSTDTSQHGVTVYTSIFDQYALTALGNSIASSVASSVGLSSNGVRRKADTEGYYWNAERQWDIKDPSLGTLSDYYGIPTWAAKFGIRSMIVEHGFMSNPSDRNIIFSDGAVEKMAKAEADAIIAYYTNHTHSYSAPVRDFPSCCVFQGKTSEHCTVCGHRRNIQLLPAAPDNHYWETSTVNVPASCGHDGSVTRTCRITDNLIDKGYKKIAPHTVTEVIPAPSQHNYAVIEKVDATHTVDGFIRYSCKNCGNTFSETLAAEGHNFQYVSYTAPTCTEAGGTLYRCDGCGEERTDTEAALGHKYVVIDGKEPGCEEAGSKISECSVCKNKKTEELAPKGHNKSNCVRVEPTCVEPGSLTGICPDCNAEISEVIKALGHTYTETVIKEAACTQGGEVHVKCSACGEEHTESTDATGHDCRLVLYTAPTCTESGSSLFICSRCSESFSGSLPAVGHDMRTVSETEGSIFRKGERHMACAVCGETVTEEVSAPIVSYLIYGFALISALLLAASIVLSVVAVLKRRRTDDESSPKIDLVIDSVDAIDSPAPQPQTDEQPEEIEKQ